MESWAEKCHYLCQHGGDGWSADWLTDWKTLAQMDTHTHKHRQTEKTELPRRQQKTSSELHLTWAISQSRRLRFWTPPTQISNFFLHLSVVVAVVVAATVCCLLAQSQWHIWLSERQTSNCIGTTSAAATAAALIQFRFKCDNCWRGAEPAAHTHTQQKKFDHPFLFASWRKRREKRRGCFGCCCCCCWKLKTKNCVWFLSPSLLDNDGGNGS